MTKFKKILFLILLMIPMYVFASGEVNISTDSITVSQEDTESFTINATDASGKITITTNDKRIATVDKTSIQIDNEKVTIKVSGVKQGKTAIVVDVNCISVDKEKIRTTKIIPVTVTPPKSSNNNLSDLKINGETIDGFSSDDTSYKYSTEENSVAISATPEDDKSTVSGDGTKKLKYGDNKFTIKVTAENGKIKSYVITINRKDDRDNNNYLRNITLSDGYISFNKSTTNYTVNVGKDVSSIKISAIAESSFAKVSGTGTKSLKPGSNEFKIVVTAENEEKRNYIVKINRDDGRDTNNYLKSLTLSEGTLTFNKNTTNYSVSINGEITEIKIDATAESTKAKVSGIGTKTIKKGLNNYQVVVTAENGDKRAYELKVTLGDIIIPKYTLTYDKESYAYCDSEEPEKITQEEDTEWGHLCVPDKEGYIFIGWYDDETNGMLIRETSTADKDITVYARFSKAKPKSESRSNIGINFIFSITSFGLGLILGIFIMKKKYGTSI